MPINVPDNPKVYTTKYQNFKGVDFTNDPTNVWYRRSPSAVNMLPDASGRPFKRHGWNILLSNSDICTALSVPSCTIKKCAYFELAGVDHIVVFTNYGVLFYNKSGVTVTSTEYDCYMGYDRCFFFEGNGTSAFYIYGNFRVWRYEVDSSTLSGFALNEVTPLVDVPTVLISTSADCTGTFLNGYNLLGTKAAVEYCDYSLFTWWASDGLNISVPNTFKDNYTQGNMPKFMWEYDSEQVDPNPKWVSKNGGVSFANSGISVSGTPKDGDQIVVLWLYGVLLPNNVSQDAVTKGDVRVWVSKSSQYDFELPVYTANQVLSTGQCRLITDETKNREQKRAWIQFYSSGGTSDGWSEVVQGEDFIKVSFPSVKVEMTPLSGVTETATASLVGA